MKTENYKLNIQNVFEFIKIIISIQLETRCSFLKLEKKNLEIELKIFSVKIKKIWIKNKFLNRFLKLDLKKV